MATRIRHSVYTGYHTRRESAMHFLPFFALQIAALHYKHDGKNRMVMGNRKGKKMIGIRNMASYALAATLALTAIVGCKKSEPAPESQSTQTQQVPPETTAVEPKPQQDVEPAVAGEPKLGEGVKLEAAGEPIDVEIGHLVPRACDWNNDGRKDLIVGQFKDGAIRLYLNEGTNAAPVFGESSLLQAGGKPIKLDAG